MSIREGFLTPAELAAFKVCRAQNVRLEQERIPQRFVTEELRRVIALQAMK